MISAILRFLSFVIWSFLESSSLASQTQQTDAQVGWVWLAIQTKQLCNALV